ncbi:hypothetical protein Krac_2286 [Ktedonobacter racemifer DSM 44963]|uniref:Uncharacterized protein n=1 Tax=Ktedonobacter racemifer DSM 44963 TaxID=485913 RepID=D6U4X4_KTERA|nr:hypothetical protein Krac_2286 [Ktedonobacter racemifer DSM 44963]
MKPWDNIFSPNLDASTWVGRKLENQADMHSPKTPQDALPFQAWGGMRRSFVGSLGGIRRRHSFIYYFSIDRLLKNMIDCTV